MLDFKLTINITVEFILLCWKGGKEWILGMGGRGGPGSLVPSITSPLPKLGAPARSVVLAKPMKVLLELQKCIQKLKKIYELLLKRCLWGGGLEQPDPSWGRAAAQPPARHLCPATGNGGL